MIVHSIHSKETSFIDLVGRSDKSVYLLMGCFASYDIQERKVHAWPSGDHILIYDKTISPLLYSCALWQQLGVGNEVVEETVTS